MSKASKARIDHVADLARLGRILTVWAHPDDETFCCGGLLSWAAANGQAIMCVTATKGEAGSQDETRWPPEKLGKVRAKEMAAGLRELGITQHQWLDYPDGACDCVDQTEAIDRIAKIVAEFQPDTLLTFGREGWTGHPDHMTVCQWSHAALKQSGREAQVFHPVVDKERYKSHLKLADEKLNMFFAVDEPPLKSDKECAICLTLPEAELSKKLRAIAAMPSQTESMLQLFGEDFLHEAWSVESFVRCSA